MAAIDLNTGNLKWRVPHGDTPDNVRTTLQRLGVNYTEKTGQGGSTGVMITKTMVVAGDFQSTNPGGRPAGPLLRAYDKQTGAELVNILSRSFLPGSNGDPRVLFDQHSGRWIIMNTDFNLTATIFLAVSLTDDPTGEWFKTSFVTAADIDVNNWPDYPTLGVDDAGIYVTAYMVSDGMSIFAIDKAPLIADPPNLGTIYAFRGLTFQGAIQPAHTYGPAPAQYFVSRSSNSNTNLRVFRVDHASAPWTMTDQGLIPVPAITSITTAPGQLQPRSAGRSSSVLATAASEAASGKRWTPPARSMAALPTARTV